MAYKEQLVVVGSHIGISLNGGGAPIIPGFADRIRVPFKGTITGWEILEMSEVPIEGDIVIGVKKGTYAAYGILPIFTSITGVEKPTLSGSAKNRNLLLTSWTIAVLPGDLIEFTVESAALVESIKLYIIIDETV